MPNQSLSTTEFLKRYQAQSVPAPVSAPTTAKALSATDFTQKFLAQNQAPAPEAKPNIPWRVDPSASDSALMTGAKATANVIPSALSFAKNTIKSTGEGLLGIRNIPGEVAGLVKEAGGIVPAIKAFGKEVPKATYEGFVPESARQVIAGDIEGARDTMTVDPFGQVAPVALLGRQVAHRAGVGKAVDTATSKVAQVVTKPVEAIAKRTGEAVSGTTRFGIAQATGLKPETVSTVAKRPEAFSKEAMAEVSRETLGKEIETRLNEKLDALTETGKGYQPVRELQAVNRDVANTNVKVVKEAGRSIVYDLIHAPLEKLTLPELRRKAQLLEADQSVPKALITKTNKEIVKRETAETIPHKITVSPKFVENVIKSTAGVEVVKGKISPKGTSAIRDAGDVRALQHLLSFWSPIFAKGFLTVDELLNFRTDMAKLSRFEKEIGKRTDVEKLTGIMRAKFNEKYREQVPGLGKLDEEFSARKEEFTRLKDELFDKNNQLKKSATDKIANSLGRGQRKADFLEKLEEISPGITEKIKILKAVEDIQDATGQKVGTYLRPATILGAGYLLGVVPAVITAILASPTNAVAIIRRYGLIKNSDAVQAVMKGLNDAAKNVNAIPSHLDTDVKKIRETKVPAPEQKLFAPRPQSVAR